MTTTTRIPYNTVKDLIDQQWDFNKLTKPLLIVANEGVEPPRIELNNDDVVNITSGVPSEVEQPIGTWVYAHRTWKITVDLATKMSRERLWQIKDEIRRICHKNTHSIEGYQRIQYMQFSEMVDQQFNVWQGKIDIELVSNAVLRET